MFGGPGFIDSNPTLSLANWGAQAKCMMFLGLSVPVCKVGSPAGLLMMKNIVPDKYLVNAVGEGTDGRGVRGVGNDGCCN